MAKRGWEKIAGNFQKNISFSIDNAGGAATIRPR